MSNGIKTYTDDEYGKIEYKELPVMDGDVVVVKAGISQGAIDSLADMLGNTGRQHSIIVAVSKMSDIRALSPEVMSNYGWYKSDKLKIASKYLETKIREEREREDNGIAGIYNGIYFMLTGKYYET